jgi:Tol biopolymer transport system component
MRRLTVLAVSTAVLLALCLVGLAPGSVRTEARGSLAARESTAAKIVFARGWWVDSAIWTVKSDATGLKRVTRPPKGSLDMYPTWSPTRDRIAFFRLVPVGEDFRGDITYRSDLMVMSAGGNALRRLVGGVYGGSGEHGPAWSPDGERLAFIKPDGRKPWIWTIRADGSGARRLVSGTDINHPVWSPNGREIAFDQWTGEQQEFFVMKADGAGLRKLIPGFRGTTYWSVDWSPNGSQIALAHGHRTVEALAEELDAKADSIRTTFQRGRKKGLFVTIPDTDPQQWGKASTRA